MKGYLIFQSDALYRLQQALGYDWLTVDSETVRLRRPSPLWVDVGSFTALAQSADPAEHAAAVALYTDDLLPELYDDWL